MKWKLCLVLTAFMLTGRVLQAQSFEIEQLLLDWEKLKQEKQLLSDLYSGYETLSKGYGAIRDIARGNFDLHKLFIDGLAIVSPAVRNYKRVWDIVRLEEGLFDRWTRAWALFKGDGHFSLSELDAMGKVYSGILDESGRLLSTLTTVLTDGVWRASDAERFEAIDSIYRNMQGQYRIFSSFTDRAGSIALQRKSEEKAVQQAREIYGLNP